MLCETVGVSPLVVKLVVGIRNFAAFADSMKSFSVSSTAHIPRSNAVICLAFVAVLFSFSFPVAAQSISSADLLSAPLADRSSTVVPTRTPEKLLARSLRSFANAVRGEQTVQTRRGVGFRAVNVRAQDEIWLVSARQQQYQCELTLQRLIDGQWVHAGMAELTDAHAVDQHRSSVVYVHGNRTDGEYARSRGLQFYENVFNGEPQSGPVRFVIFAWRSERERIRPTSDFNVKLDRSVELGSTFASFLDQFQDRRIVLCGFSLGGQVVLSGLSQLQPQAEEMLGHETGRFQVALITPVLKAEDAINSVVSLPHNPEVARTVVFVNRKDSALRAARLAARVTSHKPAVTLEQIAAAPACESINSVVIEDMTAQVTCCHSITRYSEKSLRLRTVVNEMANEVRDGQDLCFECESIQSQIPLEMVESVSEEPESVVIQEPESVTQEPINENSPTEISSSRAELVRDSKLSDAPLAD